MCALFLAGVDGAHEKKGGAGACPVVSGHHSLLASCAASRAILYA
jgi:hypothetical protein